MNPEEQKSQVTPAATTTPVAAAPAQTTGKKMNKNVLIGIIVGAVLLAGVLAWAVYAAISNSPDNLMKSALQNLVNEKQLAGTLKIEDGAGDAKTSVDGSFAGEVDPSNYKNGQMSVTLGTNDQKVSLHGLVLDKTVYLKLAGAENIGAALGMVNEPSAGPETLAAPQFASMLKNINDQWFELTEQDLKSAAGAAGGSAATPVAGASPEDTKRVMEIYGQHSFIKADKIFADEVVDGANSAHFSLRLDRNEYVKFMQAVKDANLATVKVTDKDIEDAKKEEERPKDAQIELWITRDSKEFKQLRVLNTKQGEESTFTMTFTGNMPEMQKYEKPADAKPLAELMVMLLGPSINAVDLEALQKSQSSELYLTQ